MMQLAAKLSMDLAIDKFSSYIFRRENAIFVNFFQIQNLRQGYTGLFLKQNREYFFFYTLFLGYLCEKSILLKKLN
jgi:hypothetical protein